MFCYTELPNLPSEGTCVPRLFALDVPVGEESEDGDGGEREHGHGQGG